MQEKTTTKTKSWIGWIMSSIVILFMLFDAIGKFMKMPEVVQATVGELGYADHHLLILGVLSSLVTVLYLIPRTSFIGAILLTAYLGGAMASQLRVDHPLLSHILFPFYLALPAWAGLLLRHPYIAGIVLPKRQLIEK